MSATLSATLSTSNSQLYHVLWEPYILADCSEISIKLWLFMMMIMIECHGGCHCCLFVGTGRRKPPASHLYSTLLHTFLLHSTRVHAAHYCTLTYCKAHCKRVIYIALLCGSDVQLYIVASALLLYISLRSGLEI